MWPDRVSNPGPLTYESGALPTALRGSARVSEIEKMEESERGRGRPNNRARERVKEKANKGMSKGEKKQAKERKKQLSERVRNKASERTSAWIKKGEKRKRP